ncbi:extended synaptotagmin-2 [Ixodes scapularis]|uniref:extended synaptotagmin-2 n=1 Tax=Ixodes scapularis TaxID=6945 RepID=UPI001A9D8FDC|nr:extended synaptotagmin-2 [Ixodes scapularis]
MDANRPSTTETPADAEPLLPAEKLPAEKPASTEPVKQARAILRTTLGSLVYKFAKGMLIAGSLYIMGWLNLSPAWLLMGVASYVAQKNYIEQKRIRTGITSTEHEKASVLATLEDLPAWVFFPDTERAEWVNKILGQFWPFVGNYVKDLILESIEPSVRSSLPAYLHSFKFEKIDLGDVPPRIGGVKVYKENVSRNEVIMDLELFYSGDCKFSIKVKGFKAGIRDLQVHGHLRVVMRPLTKEMPIVGGVTVFFLRPPAIDFQLTNLGQVLEVPGLNDLLKKAVSDQVAAMMVLPNKFSMKLQEHVSTQSLRFSLPCGVLRLEVVAAKDLVKADIGMLGLGKSDPYAIITVGAQEFRTQVIPSTVNPKWNFYCEAVIYQIPGCTVDIDVMDEDQSSKDDFLGRVSVSVSDLQDQGQGDMWLTLDDTKSGKIRLRTFWLSLTTDTDDLPLQLERVKSISTKTPLSTAVLIVFLDSAKHLPNASRAAGEPSPQVQLVLGHVERWSSIKHSTNDPVWEEIFYLLLANPEVQEMEIKVVDNKTGQVLGHLPLRLSRLLKEEGLKIDEPLILLGTGHQAKLKLTLQLRLLHSAERRSSTSGTPVQRHRASVRSVDETGPTASPSHQQPSPPPPPPRGSPPPSPRVAAAPSLDEVVQSTVSPILDSMAMGERALDASHRDPQREVLGDPGAGKLQLTLRYSAQRSRLVVVIHRAVNLAHKEGDDLPDPYVKLHLLPDKLKENKRKTQTCRNSCNPVFDETMEIEGSLSELEGSTLQVSVNSKSGSSMFSRGKVLGSTQVSLANLDLTKAHTDWYDLEVDA